MRKHPAIWAIVGGLCAAPMAHAEPRFAPPAGCEVQFTVQMHSCQVANYYTCAGDAPGDIWASFADGEGEYFVSHTDAETRWVESIALADGEVDRLDMVASADNASFSELLASGRDDYDFVTRSNHGTARRYIGHDLLTGERTTIDGVPLERAGFEMRIEDNEGAYIATRSGMQYISRKLRVFFGDTERFENAFGDTSDTAQAPVTFAFPGEQGFAAATPNYDCDMMMTELEGAGQ